MKKFEGSKIDKAKDKKAAKKLKMPVSRYEGSPADNKADKAGQKKLNKRK